MKIFKKKSILIITLVSIALLSLIYLFQIQKIKTNDEEIFTRIYSTSEWSNNGGTGSGAGSNPKNAVPYLAILQEYFNSSKFNTFYDLGCGDWQLMSRINIPESKIYNGFDLVGNVISQNEKRYKKENVNFYHIHELSDFANEKGDLLIAKDVLAHWTNERIKYFLNKILPNFKYALITIDYKINGETNLDNKDKEVGHHRAIDLFSSPFFVKKNFTVIKDYQAEPGIVKRIYLYTNEASN